MVYDGDKHACVCVKLCKDKRDLFSATSAVMGSLSLNLNKKKNPIDFEMCAFYDFETDAGHKVKANGMLIK